MGVPYQVEIESGEMRVVFRRSRSGAVLLFVGLGGLLIGFAAAVSRSVVAAIPFAVLAVLVLGATALRESMRLTPETVEATMSVFGVRVAFSRFDTGDRRFSAAPKPRFWSLRSSRYNPVTLEGTRLRLGSAFNTHEEAVELAATLNEFIDGRGVGGSAEAAESLSP